MRPVLASVPYDSQRQPGNPAAPVVSGTATHTKYLLIEGSYKGVKDQKLVFTGSHPYTGLALTANDEALLKYVGPEMHDAYVTNFRDQRAAALAESQYGGVFSCCDREGSPGCPVRWLVGEPVIFHFDRRQAPTPGKLLYIEDELSLFFEESDPLAQVQSGRDRTEISVGPVDLTVHLPTGKVLFASGYAPREGWRPGTVTPPPHQAGAVAVTGLDALPGMAVRVDAGKYGIALDGCTGWLQVTAGVPTHEALAFAEGTVIGVDAAGGLSGLWLKPGFAG
jgi:hypothetical protein